jgi:glycosyltransferase involved in cell wall biosynthesis
MPKIIRVITRLNIGGPAIHTVLLTRDLVAAGYDTILVTGSCEEEDEDMTYLLQPGDPVRWIPEMSRSVQPWKNMRALWRLWRLMRNEKPLIVHTHTAMAGCLGRMAALLSGVPIVVHTFHGNSLQHYFSPVVNRVFLAVERSLARVTDAICVVAPQQAKEMSEQFKIAPRQKFKIIPLGLELGPFLSIPAPNLNAEAFRVGWVGRLVEVKNVPLLLSVIEKTLQSTDRFEFLIAGDGPEGPLVRKATERFGKRVVWYGWQKDIANFVARCHLLVQTSKNEGTPVALIQGMAAARPFVSTQVGGIVDMVAGPPLRTVGGCSWFSNAVLAEPNAESFANALLELAAAPDLVRTMGERSRELAANRYTKEKLLRNLDNLYQQLIAARLKKSLAEKRMPNGTSETGCIG